MGEAINDAEWERLAPLLIALAEHLSPEVAKRLRYAWRLYNRGGDGVVREVVIMGPEGPIDVVRLAGFVRQISAMTSTQRDKFLHVRLDA